MRMHTVVGSANEDLLILYSLKMPKQLLQCPFCSATSSHGAGLASHIRSAHPKEHSGWSRARKSGQQHAAPAGAEPAAATAAGFDHIVAGLERQKEAIEAALSALRSLDGGVAKRKRGRPRKNG